MTALVPSSASAHATDTILGAPEKRRRGPRGVVAGQVVVALRGAVACGDGLLR